MSIKDRCDDERLVLYHYNELDPEADRQLAQHLEECAACRTALEQIETSLAVVTQPPLTLDAAQKQRFTEQVLTSTRRQPLRLRPLWGTALAASGALALAIIFLPPPQQEPDMGQNQALAELEILEQFELLQELDILQDLELLEELEDLG